MNHYKNRSAVRTDNPLKLAVWLALNQLSQGIGLAEAVHFAKYHNVTCAAIEAELLKSRTRSSLL